MYISLVILFLIVKQEAFYLITAITVIGNWVACGSGARLTPFVLQS
jgi:hypothetical protein